MGARKYWEERKKQFAFRYPGLPSESLYDEIVASARVNVFLQEERDVLAWCRDLEPKLRGELLLHGLSVIMKSIRTIPTASNHASLLHRLTKKKGYSAADAKVRNEKLRGFDRIVEMLDAHDVDGKLLGDCTKGDLLRAAAAAEAVAGEATMNAQFYRLLAEMLPDHGVSVRQANNRKEVVALLTTTFKETAE